MRLLFVYRVCGLGGVETSIINKFEALGRQGIEASALFGQFYGEGGKELALRERRISVGLTSAGVKELVAAHDAISVIDYPEFLDVLDEWQLPKRVLFESHVPPPLQRCYHVLAHPAISAILVPSQFNKEAIEQTAAPRKEIIVIPNAIDPAVFQRRGREAVRELFGELADSPTVVWVGRLEQAKLPEDCVRVGATVLAKRPDVRFVMVGDSDDYEAYHTRLRNSLSPALRNRFTFLRRIPYGEMPALYSLAALTGGCLLSTSRYESLPMVLIEAMACECPVVVSNVAGVGEVVIDHRTGRLYEVGDVAGAARAVLELLDPTRDATRHELVERAYQTVVNRHSLDEAGRRYAAILRPPRRARPRPLVSAIMIFLNAEAFIEEAIESVLVQTYDSWELFLVDDGSTDASTDIARQYAAKYPHKVRYLEHPGHVNRGKSASRNLGVQQAGGTYLAFLDADDVWLPNKLAEQVEILETYPEAAMVYGRTLRWHSWTLHPDDEPRDRLTELGVAPNQLIQPPEPALASLKEDYIPATCSVLIRRRALDPRACFVGELEAFEDLAFYMPIFLRAPVFASSRCWDRYRQHPDMSCAVALRTKHWHPVNPNPHREKYLRWLDRTLEQMEVSNREIRRVLALRLWPYRHPLVSRFSSRAKHVVQRMVHGVVVFALDQWRRLMGKTRGHIETTPNPARLNDCGISATTLLWRSTATAVELRVGAPAGLLYCRSGPSGHITIPLWPGERRLWYLQDASKSQTPRLRNTLGLASMAAPEIAAFSTTVSAAYSITTVTEDRPRTLLMASAQPIVVGRGAVVGHLESIAAESDTLRVVGWAASLAENARPCKVVVFVGKSLRAIATTGVERSDLTDGPFVPYLRTAGFECAMPGNAAEVNHVRVFAISSRQHAVELPRVVRRWTRRQYQLSRDPTGAESLSADDGSEVPIAPGAIEGFLEAAILDHGRALFMGWAAEPARSLPVHDVVLFVDDRCAGVTCSHIERPDVVQAFGTEALRFTGFSFNRPYRIVPDHEIRSVRAFAISHSGTASELRSLSPFRARRARATGTTDGVSIETSDRSPKLERSTPRPLDRGYTTAEPPLVTSIITTYNHARYIEQAVRSVQAQNLYGRHLIIVIDDCSTDGTLDVLRRIWTDDQERIQLIVAPKNEHSNRRFAAVLQECQSQFVAMLDGDDYWTDPLKLQTQVDFLQAHPTCAMSCHNALVVHEDGTHSRPYVRSTRKRIATLPDILERNFICSSTVVLRTRATRALPSWYATAPYRDWPLWVLAARHADIGYVDEIMAAYRVHKHGLWSGASRIRQLEWDLRLYECLALNLAFGRDIIERRRWQRTYDLAVEHEKRGDVRQAAKYLRLCLANRPPGALESHLQGAGVAPPEVWNLLSRKHRLYSRPWRHRLGRMLRCWSDVGLPEVHDPII